MPPKLKVGKKKGKGKKKKGKKKKVKAEISPPPLHLLTELYNKLREVVFDLRRTQVTARKKRLEGWYMTREMINLQNDNQVYRSYLQEKMEDVERLIKDITALLEKERADVERSIRERMAEYDRKIDEFRNRMTKGETELMELKIKLLKFEPLIKKLAALLAKLKELQEQIGPAELEANIKTRHLKTQYLFERAKLYNHLENELHTLICTCRSHLMPILWDHMSFMRAENEASRLQLSKLDTNYFKLSHKKEELVEKRNRLNIERGYLSLDWAFGKLAQYEKKKKAKVDTTITVAKPSTSFQDECELSIAFKQYLNKRLQAERLRKAREDRLQRKREEKQRLLAIQQERERKQAEKAAACLAAVEVQEAEEEDEEYEDYEHEGGDDEYEDLEYYEDEFGNLVLATASRMKEHKALMENKSALDLGDEDQDSDDDADEDDQDYGEDEGSSFGSEEEGSGSYSSSFSSGSSFASDDGVIINGDQPDYGQGDDDLDSGPSGAKLGQSGPSNIQSMMSAFTSTLPKTEGSKKPKAGKAKAQPKAKTQPKKKK